jgi:hypothetical protein
VSRHISHKEKKKREPERKEKEDYFQLPNPKVFFGICFCFFFLLMNAFEPIKIALEIKNFVIY